jgi:hypothetical protein
VQGSGEDGHDDATHHDTNDLLSLLQDDSMKTRDETDCDQSFSSLPGSNPSSNDVFDLVADRRMARFQELLEYREKFGHCMVPYNYKEKPLLYSWVKRQRNQYKRTGATR